DGNVLAIGGQDGATFAECYLYDPVADAWSPTTSLTTPRRHHTATLLTDGRVLVTGGYDDSANVLDSAEIYDPYALPVPTWTPTASLTFEEKAWHTATLLQDSRVMVTGGVTVGTVPTDVTEVFDPAGPSWTRVGDLETARYQHSATLLPDGTVLVAGGWDGLFGFPTTVEIFDPVGGTWSTSTATLNFGRAEHSATLLPSGQVVVAGGYVIPPLPVTPLDSVELWDPGDPGPPFVPPSWTLLPNMSTVRYRHSATMLPDGRVLVAGGFDDTGALAGAELLDVDNPVRTPGGNMVEVRREHTLTLLKDGRLLAVGGVGSNTAEVGDPVGANWNLTANSMSTVRYRHTATLLNDGRVLVAGTVVGASDTAELFEPGSNQWVPTGSMAGNRYEHTATLLPCGEVLVVGGESSSGVVLATAERYNPRTGTWRSTGSLNQPRWAHTATLLPDGKVMVAGGWNGGRTNTIEIYDPATEIWVNAAVGLWYGRYHHRATRLPSGNVLITGGGLGSVPAEEFDWMSGSVVVGAPNDVRDNGFSSTLLPNGRVLVAGGVTNASRMEVYDPAYVPPGPPPPNAGWTVMPDTLFARNENAAAVLLDGRVILTGGGSATTEIFDVGRGEDPAWRPVLSGATDPLVEGSSLLAVGTGFTGLGEGSGGLGYMSSATNYPLVQLRRLDNDAVRWLPVDPAAEWKDAAFTSRPLTGCVPGPTRVTVFTNGIPSHSRIIDVECLPPTVVNDPVGQDICVGASVNFTVSATGECLTYQWRQDGTPLAEAAPFAGTRTDTLSITNAMLSEAGNYDAVAESSCSSQTDISAAAALTFTGTLTNVAVTLTAPPDTVCTTCVGGTISESHTNGGAVTYEWGYRRVSGSGPITWMPGYTGPTYDINGSDFPGPGTYYVVARTTPTCGLPEISANEVTVTVTLASPGDEVDFFTVTSRNQENVLEWVSSGLWGGVRIRYNAGPTCTFPTDPISSGTLLADLPGATSTRARFVHDTPPLTNGWDYCYTIFSDMGGPPYSVGRSNSGRPMDTSGPVKWAFSTGVFSLTAPTVGWSGIIATSNDHVVHAMERGLGGGEWPAGWLPIRLNGPVQSRSPIVPIDVNGANPVVYLGSQDGSVYVVDADLGGAFGGYPRAPVALGGAPGQAAPAGIFTAFGGAHDYLLVGTRDATVGADNRFFAIDPDLMTVVNPTFDNGGGANGIGIINGMATVDYPSTRVYFTSHAKVGGSQATLWCMDLPPVPPPVFSLAWTRNLTDIDSSPVLMNGRVLVGSAQSSGRLWSVEATLGVSDYWFDHTDGQVKDFVFPDWRTGDLYFATDSYVWALHDDGASITNKFPGLPFPGGIDLGGGVVPTSAAVFVPGNHYVYVGGSNGRLYEIDVLAGPAPTIKSVVLGDGLATVGAPSLDWSNSMIHVGTEAGVFYAVEIPF
ncbi:MAG: kelch repeat-containing protein, partial [Acidobacteriota bacterium]